MPVDVANIAYVCVCVSMTSFAREVNWHLTQIATKYLDVSIKLSIESSSLVRILDEFKLLNISLCHKYICAFENIEDNSSYISGEIAMMK